MGYDKMKKEGFIAEGTTCESCAKIIERQAHKIDGVEKVTFDYETETGYVTYDETKTDIDTILYKIEEKEYSCYILDDTPGKVNSNALGIIFGLIGIIIVGYFFFNFIEGFNVPQISQNMGYGLLFLVGLLTGVHCVGMCGGFVVSYTAKHAQEGTSSHGSYVMYGLGKTISYTIIGAIFGLLGSIIAFTPMMRGIAGLLAGLFLILFGLKMLSIFPVLRKFSLTTPRFISRFVGKESRHSSPLMIGLLNGLMIACGPLQAIYIMAAGTGSMIEGAKLLFIFALGTLPVMLGFGLLTTFISTKVTQKILKASGVIVILLGLIMVNRGLALTGTGFDTNSLIQSVSATGNTVNDEKFALQDGYQIIEMDVTRYGWSPDSFVLKKGVPVKWIINGKEITGCNNAINVPKLDLEFDIRQGTQTIEFTPDEEGIIPWSCWMGMIPGTFIVKDDIDLSDRALVEKELSQLPEKQAGSCGGSCGGATCGARTGGSCGCGI